MQLCCADVRIGGSVQHVVPKEGLTPAEILVLRRIHGDDAVVNIRPTGSKNLSHAEEFDRLRQRYGRAGAMSSEGEPSVKLDQMFPGAVKKLPLRLKDIGLDVYDRPDSKPAAAPVQQESSDGEETGGEVHEEAREPEAAEAETGDDERSEG